MKKLDSVLILLVGNELLNGSIQDKNAKLLLSKLSFVKDLNLEVQILPDKLDLLADKILSATNSFDLIVTSGGLGPTTDDLTIDAICKGLRLKKDQDLDSLKRLEEKYKKRGRPLTQNSLKQTYFPESSLVLVNEVGTADSCITKFNNCCIASFPGVPKEYEYFINGSFWNWLNNNFNLGENLSENYFRVFGLSEAYIGSKIESLNLDYNKITVAYRPQFPEVLVSLKSSIHSQNELNDIQSKIIQAIGSEFVFSKLENENLPSALLKVLSDKKLTITTAESCTGGRIASEITKIPGSSEALLGSIICYSNKVKKDLLKVPPDILKEKGAVSEDVAIILAKQIRESTGSDYAVSVTGIAGPGGETKDKPVGLVYIGISCENKTLAFKYNIPWERERNQIYATWLAFDLIRRSILNCNLTWEIK